MIIFNSPITVEKHKNNTIATPKNTYTYTVHSPQQGHNSVIVIEKHFIIYDLHLYVIINHDFTTVEK